MVNIVNWSYRLTLELKFLQSFSSLQPNSTFYNMSAANKSVKRSFISKTSVMAVDQSSSSKLQACD